MVRALLKFMLRILHNILTDEDDDHTLGCQCPCRPYLVYLSDDTRTWVHRPLVSGHSHDDPREYYEA